MSESFTQALCAWAMKKHEKLKNNWKFWICFLCFISHGAKIL